MARGKPKDTDWTEEDRRRIALNPIYAVEVPWLVESPVMNKAEWVRGAAELIRLEGAAYFLGSMLEALENALVALPIDGKVRR